MRVSDGRMAGFTYAFTRTTLTNSSKLHLNRVVLDGRSKELYSVCGKSARSCIFRTKFDQDIFKTRQLGRPRFPANRFRS